MTYSIACFLQLIENAPVLFFDQDFGELSTSLLYSAFESWMVTEYHKRNLEKSRTSLSNIFGIMTSLSCIVAILAGVFSEGPVEVTKTKRAPFMASAGLLAIVLWAILISWASQHNQPIHVSSERPLTTRRMRTMVLPTRSCTQTWTP